MLYTPGKEYNLYKLLQKADLGDIDAMETVVSLLVAEGYTKEDPDGEIGARLIGYLEKLAEEGKAFAWIMLGDAYKDGDWVEKDLREAIRLYEKAAENGIRFGYECIGMLYYEGIELPADYGKAYAYFTKEDGSKSFCTLYALGEMFRQGFYVEKDDGKAFEYYASIVNNGSPYPEQDAYYLPACYRLGVAYHYGMGTEEDAARAAALVSEAKAMYGKDRTVFGGITKEEFRREWMLLNSDEAADEIIS